MSDNLDFTPSTGFDSPAMLHEPESEMPDSACKAFTALTEKARKINKNYDLEKIEAAYDLAAAAHGDIKRKSGELYISHPIAVADILLDMFMDTDTIVAALLHDVVEDTDITLDTLRRKFGGEVAYMVDGVTKIEKIKLKTPGQHEDQEGVPMVLTEEEQKAENIRKILVAMSKDIRVIIIKLADRLHNIRTLAALRPDKQRRIALETLSFYAPLAHRLGIAAMKEEMENTSLFYLDEFAYKEIEDSLERHKQDREDFIDKIIARIKDRLSDMDATIEGRIKGIYSLYKKWYTAHKNLDEIYDVYAIRIIVDSTADCYAVMGEIHDMFTPISMRFKDYIASPKLNGYQSLHTTVLGRERQPFEVQIRTNAMHNTARFGVAAHWRYKLGINDTKQPESRFDFIRELLERQQHTDDVEQLAEAIKTDLSPDEVHVFTPQGDPKSLPKGSTVVDFAYAVHTEVGHRMKGAKVHSKMVSFDYVLNTGDVVEIITSTSLTHAPNRSWLDYAKTTDAKAKIRNWLRKERRDENIASGRACVEGILKRFSVSPDEEMLIAFAQSHRFHCIDDFYAAIGYGGIKTEDVSLWVKYDLARKHERPELRITPEQYVKQNIKNKQSAGVIIEGIGDCFVKFASCCNPLPGDEIIGFVTRGHGVSIHSKYCANIAFRMRPEFSHENLGRLVDAAWTETAHNSYTAGIEIIAINSTDLLPEITASIAANQILIVKSSFRKLRNGNTIANFTVEIKNMEQLRVLMTMLGKISGVISVERA